MLLSKRVLIFTRAFSPTPVTFFLSNGIKQLELFQLNILLIGFIASYMCNVLIVYISLCSIFHLFRRS